MDLSKELAILASSDIEDSIESNNEDDDEITLESLSIEHYINKTRDKDKPRNDKKDKFFKEDMISDLDEISYDNSERKRSSKEKLLDAAKEFNKYDLSDRFDDFLSDDDEMNSIDNIELKNSLISLGRKYTRETAVSAETSEIIKTFSGAEKDLKKLYDEISRDKELIQKDIDQMRMARSRNFKSLSDLLEAKNQSHSTQLNIIKEINNIHKAQFDLKFKEEKNKGEEIDNNISNNTIRDLFTLGKSDMMNSIGGYRTVSGALSEEESDEVLSTNYELSDEEIQSKYFNNNDSDYNDDGEAFLKYEGQQIDYVLLVDNDNVMQDIFAEDSEGNIVPDYPMPSNINELSFDIDTKTMTAEDGLHRIYKLRYV
jgi:hypothetical protein